MYIEKSRGPKIDPWGTPFKTGKIFEELCCVKTDWERPERYDLIKLTAVDEKLKN